ncbi:MAG: LutC/YkgG family protein [Porphyromonas sp.]
MLHAKQGVLENIRKYTTKREAHPDLSAFKGITYPDKVSQFETIIEAVGGRVVHIEESTDLGKLLRELYPEATRFISDLSLGTLPVTRPSEAGSPTDRNGTDVTIVQTPLGVCENGCCWVQQEGEWRSELFISENLVFILDKDNLVHNMHEAMKRVRELAPATPFSGFISGPSKTADIEQALVIGAHGARGVIVLLK